MAIIRVNAHHDTCHLHGSAQSLGRVLTRAVRDPGPVIILIPGFGYQPGHRNHCPHQLVLGLTGQAVPSWPRGLGFGRRAPDEGLAVGFGWQARGSIWGARRRALTAARALAALVTDLRQRAPHRPLHIVAHSMGVEVAVQALHHLPGGAVNRIISMTGATYQSRVLAALATPAGQTAEFFNVVSHANTVFEQIYERLIAAPESGDRSLGHGVFAPNALNLQLDCNATLARLAELGTPVTGPVHRLCHWSSYTRPGALDCYRAWLRNTDLHNLDRLRSALPARAFRPGPTDQDTVDRPLSIPDMIRRAVPPDRPARMG